MTDTETKGAGTTDERPTSGEEWPEQETNGRNGQTGWTENRQMTTDRTETGTEPETQTANSNSNGRAGQIQSNRTDQRAAQKWTGMDWSRRLERLKSDGSCNLTTGRPRSGHKEAGTESEPPDEAVDDDKWKWRRQRRQRWQRRWRHGRTTS